MDTLDDFIEAETNARLEADSHVKPEQILQSGDYCMRVSHGFSIYSEILDAAEMTRRGRSLSDLDEEEQDEYQSILELYNEPHMKLYRFTRSFSSVCPGGELGDIHLSTVRKISKEEFEKAREEGWT
jgi:hypothetical protein